jgi:transcriptional regulator of arginine metabolism
MHDLRVSRVAAGGKATYAIPQEQESEALAPLVGAEVLSIDASESLIVVHTRPACANLVGEYIDLQRFTDILGTVAGDNTLLVIPRSINRTRHVVEFIRNLFSKGTSWKK